MLYSKQKIKRCLKNKIKWSIFFANLFLIFGIGFIVFYLITSKNSKWNDLGLLSNIGDFFSGTAGVLINISVLFFIYSSFLTQSQELKLQREELRLQRKEFELTRKVFEDEREEMKEQTKMFSQQAFENGFFSLFNILLDHLKDKTHPKQVKSISECIDILNGAPLKKASLKDAICFHFIQQEYLLNLSKYTLNVLSYIDNYNVEISQNKNAYYKIIDDILSKRDKDVLKVFIFHNNYVKNKFWKKILNVSQVQGWIEQNKDYSFGIIPKTFRYSEMLFTF